MILVMVIDRPPLYSQCPSLGTPVWYHIHGCLALRYFLPSSPTMNSDSYIASLSSHFSHHFVHHISRTKCIILWKPHSSFFFNPHRPDWHILQSMPQLPPRSLMPQVWVLPRWPNCQAIHSICQIRVWLDRVLLVIEACQMTIILLMNNHGRALMMRSTTTWWQRQ